MAAKKYTKAFYENWAEWYLVVAGLIFLAAHSSLQLNHPLFNPDDPRWPLLAMMWSASLLAICLAGIAAPWHEEFQYRNNCIYLVRRKDDGIYKIGKTSYFQARLPRLCEEYGDFDVVHVWPVENMHETEKVALSLTKKYFFKEYGHRELRQMTHVQLRQFLNEFTTILLKGDAHGG